LGRPVIDKRTGANGEKWGRTPRRRSCRRSTEVPHDTDAVGARGGWHLDGWARRDAALAQLPGIWGAIGAHSAALRPEGDAPTYLRFGADFAARDPLALIKAHPDVARQYAWWIDAR